MEGPSREDYMLRLLVAALLVAQTGCIFVTRRNPPPAERRGGGGGKVTHDHCHPKKHGREVCHAHPHYDPGHH
jgi:hypothetical protein